MSPRTRSLWLGLAIAAIALCSSSIAACRHGDPGTSGTPGAVGTPCTTDDECAAGLSCIAATSFSGGACTRACMADADCPHGSRCGPYQMSGLTDYVPYCMQTCDRTLPLGTQCTNPEWTCEWDGLCGLFRCNEDSDCLEGSCDLTFHACRTTATNPAAHAGDSCTTDAECRGPTGSCVGFCYQPDCDRGGEYACSASETCNGTAAPDTPDVLFYSCDPGCTPGVDATSPTHPGVCAAGEICVPPEADPGGLATLGRCTSYDGHSFVVGSSTAHVGDPCTTDDQCPSPLGYGLCFDGRCALRFCHVAVFPTDPCGPNMVCVSGMAPAGEPISRTEMAALRTGTCVFPCSDASACPSGMVCNLGVMACQADCRTGSSPCPTHTRCTADGTCQ